MTSVLTFARVHQSACSFLVCDAAALLREKLSATGGVCVSACVCVTLQPVSSYLARSSNEHVHAQTHAHASTHTQSLTHKHKHQPNIGQ